MGNLIYLGDFRRSGKRIETIGNHWLVETLILFLLYVCVIAPPNTWEAGTLKSSRSLPLSVDCLCAQLQIDDEAATNALIHCPSRAL